MSTVKMRKEQMKHMTKFSPSRAVTAIAVMVVAVALTGCDSARQALTQTKAAPDEFSVYTRAPLTMPPDYGLRPPSEAEAAARKTDDPQVVAKRVMLSGRDIQLQPVQAATPGTSALLMQAGVQNAEPGIRQMVNRETSAFAEEDQNFMEALMFDPNPGVVVSPQKELQRLQENQALGKPVNEGDTPIIETKSKAPLEGLFDGWFN